MRIASFAAFAIGLGFGHLTLTPSLASATSGKVVPKFPVNPSNQAASDTAGSPLRSTRPREKKIPLRIDAEGNYLLPPAMADRLDCVVLIGTKVNPVDLRILGLDDTQIGQVQELVDEVFRRFFERKRAAMREFTINDDEMVWEIPGDRSGAIADEQRIIDAVHAICGAKAGLLSDRLVQQIKSGTAQLGIESYFLRAYHPGGKGSMLAFENIVISPGLNKGSQPAPGSSFMDYQKQWIFGSSGRYGGAEPPDTLMPLIGDKDWQKLLTPKL
ncbi:MAG: hypothetical protein ABIS50_02525 [Luteolibacter sp.]|uniref:hypothetical protein n=1 Tax=Luteolibacter sp. TaxID=1962973 RepID=UPI003265E005